MIKARASTLVNVPSEQVFQFIAIDFFKNYKRWSPEVVMLQPISGGPIKLGTMARQVRIDQGRRSESTFKVCAFESGKRIEFQDISRAFHVSYQMTGMADSTQLMFQFELSRVEFYMRPFEKLIRIAIQEGVEQVVFRIKGLIEADALSGRKQ